MSLPLRYLECLNYSKRYEYLEHSEPPVFIIGHWRSGTTYLHNLLSQDKRFGYVTLFQTLANDLCLSGNKVIKPILKRLIPCVRPMDKVCFAMDSPREEEHAVARFSPYSFYHQCCFPRMGPFYFEKYVLFENVSQEVVEKWKKTYLRILQKAAINTGGRRLLLKNPVNTARLKMLLELFPDAKFIHIYRNPYHVFQSTRHLYQQTLEITQLQNISQEEIDKNIIHFYKEMMKRYFSHKDSIPPENLVEVRYEDLDKSPLNEVKRIYDHLAIPGFVESKPAFYHYIADHSGYEKNSHPPLSPRLTKQINTQWRFAFDRWKYQISIDSVNTIEQDRRCSQPFQDSSD